MEASVEEVNVLICTNANYLQHVAVCLRSLLENNPELFFNIVVVGRADEDLNEKKLERSLKPSTRFSLTFKTFTPSADRTLPLNHRAHYTQDIWTRLWVADFFNADVHRVLYLDCDIVVTGSIASLWRTELDGALFGAVDIPGSRRGIENLDMRPEDGYFNSGVLIFDLDQWRTTRALNTVLKYVSDNLERLRDPDQDALNACFCRRRKRLDYKWNVIRPFYRDPPVLPLPTSEIEQVRCDARIVHFNGWVKPWSYFSDHPKKSEYYRYLRMTEWYGFVPADRTGMNILRKAVSNAFPHRTKSAIKLMFGILALAAERLMSLVT